MVVERTMEILMGMGMGMRGWEGCERGRGGFMSTFSVRDRNTF